MAALPNPRSERGIDRRLRADRARCGSVETTPGSQAWPPRSIFDWRRDRRADWCRAAAVDLPEALRVAIGIILVVFSGYSLWRPKPGSATGAGPVAAGGVGIHNGVIGGAPG